MHLLFLAIKDVHIFYVLKEPRTWKRY